MQVDHFRKRARRRAILTGAGATTLTLLLAGTAQAQDSQPTAYSSAIRYDGAGRVAGTIAPDPDGTGPLGYGATRTSYNAVGQKVKVETGELSAWQPTSVPPNAWPGFTIRETQDFAYDVMGHPVRTRTIGSDGQVAAVTDTNYDRVGRPACTAVRMNPAAFATLPANACVLGTTGTQGPDRITRKHHDAAGQLTKEQKAYGTALVQDYVSYTYSPNGKQATVTDANYNRAELRYDGHDRQTLWFFPAKSGAGQTDYSDYEQYGYDANGNRVSLRKRDGSTLTYQYDALNRVTAKIVPERAGLTAAQTRDVYYEYDLRGLQTKARFDSLAGEGITSAYDGFGRLVSSSSNMGGVARTVGTTYGDNGNRVRITHPDGSFFTYDQDGLDRATLVRENGGDPIASFTYDRAGRRARSGWAAATDYAYDPAGRLQSLSHDLAGTARDHVLGFGYNPAAQIVTRSASNDAYAWTGATNTSRPYAVNGLNQYTSAGSATFGYDPNGNLASTINAPWSTAYVYDIENRLVSASGTHSADLVYDPLGRLFQVSSGGVTRRLVYDGDALVAEYDAAGNMAHRYIHGNDPGADDPLVWYDNWASGWRRGLVADHQGSVIGVADMYGNSIAANSYDPWGIPGASNAGRFGYTGQTWVPELGLWYYKARFYSPTLGRFLQTDPIGYVGGINLYGYVENDPVNEEDYSGESKRGQVNRSYYPNAPRTFEGSLHGAIIRVKAAQARSVYSGGLRFFPQFVGQPSASSSAHATAAVRALQIVGPRNINPQAGLRADPAGAIIQNVLQGSGFSTTSTGYLQFNMSATGAAARDAAMFRLLGHGGQRGSINLGGGMTAHVTSYTDSSRNSPAISINMQQTINYEGQAPRQEMVLQLKMRY